jgi:hypothetical protein
MDLVMQQTKKKLMEEQTLDKYYKRLHFNVLVSRAERMEQKGTHLAGLNEGFAEVAYEMKGVTKESRHRLSKEVAVELRELNGDKAFFYCVEKLSNNTKNPQLWRDVLTWLEELNNEPAGAGSLTKGENK